MHCVRNNFNVPDFIIGGAPKCGTTSLHWILAQHPDIQIPNGEIYYFDADDAITHPDFLFVESGRLRWFDWQSRQVRNFDWYASHFKDLARTGLIGEDTTTYLLSDVAAHRIKQVLPHIKMIFLLRQPAERAYSQYWHLMKTGRVTVPFETALSQQPSIILGSTYASNLRQFVHLLGRDRIHIVLFEELVKKPDATINAATDFLGVPKMKVQEERTWYHRTYYPVNFTAQRNLNRIGRLLGRERYRNYLGTTSDTIAQKLRGKMSKLWFGRINSILLKAERRPAMRDETWEYLCQHLSARNRGLSDIVGRNLSEVWANFDD